MKTIVLSKRRIVEDVDTVAIIGYSNTLDRTEYVREFVKDTYDTDAPAIVNMALRAFDEAADRHFIS